MLEKYDPNVEGTHIIRVTFMQWDYVGHISYKMGGNCRGMDLLDGAFLECDNQEDIDRYVENDCAYAYDEDANMFSAILHNAVGDELEVESDTDFGEMVVAIEISELIPEQPN
jgi:hypothetical protein